VPHSSIVPATQDPHRHLRLAARIHTRLVGQVPGRWCLRVNRPQQP
jgi:hypothetical protein